MRIISKFKDYYDGAAQAYHSGTIWVRNTLYENIDVGNIQFIGFCGRIFLLNYGINRDKTYTILWEKDLLSKSIEYDLQKGIYHIVTNKKYFNNTEQYLENYRNRVLEMDLFQRFKTPIFLYDKNNYLTIDPKLKPFNFGKIFNAHQAAQEIEMYLTNELANCRNTVETVGSNEIVGNSKGFDRYSFRNAKKYPKKF